MALNRQEAFNKVYVGLLTQNCKSISKGGSCVYRGQDNTKCAVGFLIPDDKYEPSMDEDATLWEVAKAAIPDYEESDYGFISHFRNIHDSDDPVSTWKTKLTTMAVDNKLTIPEMPNA